MQDADGFIWLTTRDGLNRFDGFNFKVYQPRQADCNSIWQNNFNDAHIDHTGSMWVESACGLHQYDMATNKFLASYNYDRENDRGLSHRKIQSVFEDRQGQIWVGTNYGINKFDRANNSFDHFLPFPEAERGAGENIVAPVFEDHNGFLWIGSYLGGLSRFDPVSRTFLHYRHDPGDARSLASDTVSYVYVDRSNTLWVGTHMGLQRFDRQTGSFDHFRHDPADQSSLSDNGVTFILEDRMGTLWVGTDHGLNRFDPLSETFDRFHHNSADPYSLAGNTVRYIFEDRGGYLWVATQSTGLSRFNPHLSGFSYYNRNNVLGDSLEESLIQAVYEDRQGRLWIGTSRGLHQYDATNESFKVFLHNRDVGTANARRDDILSIHQDRAGTLWVGSRIGLSSFDPATATFHDLLPQQEINEFAANVIFEDSTGALWIGTRSGVIQFDRAQRRFVDVGNNPTIRVNLRLNSEWINLIHEDQNGDLWFGTDISLSQYHREAKYFTHHVHWPQANGPQRSISDNTALSIYEDDQGVLWIGTKNGLNRLTLSSSSSQAEASNPTFSAYGQGHGIPGKAIVGILGDDSGFLWLSTDKGLARFDPLSESAVSFDVMDGLQGNEFSTGSHARTRDGRMFFGGINGLTAFYPEQVRYARREYEPPIVLTDLLFANKSVEDGSAINYSDELVLDSTDTMFSIEFAALAFGAPDVIQYAYKLTGVNSDWIITDDNNRRATYSGLQPGNYLFQVTRVDNSGVRKAAAASIRVSILPPFWMTWWAYAAYVLAAALLVFSLVRVRTLALMRRSELLENKVVERTRRIEQNEKLIQHQADHLEELLLVKEKLFENISHEFRTPLTLILGPIERMLKQGKDSTTARQLRMVRENSQRLLRLVDQLLGLSRLSAEEPVTQSAQPLRPMVKTIVASFRPLAEEKRIQLHVVDGEDLWVNCAPDALEKILLNLVSNAIKFTPDGGWVNVTVASADNDKVRLSVSDSGIGIDAENHQAVFERFYRVNGSESAPGAGLGLALVKELAEAFGGSVELESRLEFGTAVDVLLPRHEVLPSDFDSESGEFDTGLISLEIVAAAQSNRIVKRSEIDKSNGDASILVVEDNNDMQEYLVSLLSDAYKCQVAADGEKAVSVALETVPDLVLCDVMLPKRDGFEVSKILKTNDATSHIPIVMLTALGDHDSRLKGLREHVDDYLTKPFDDEELMLRIANLLGARDALKRRYSRQLFDGSHIGDDLGQREQRFLDKVHQVLESNYSSSDFRVDDMSSAVAMSDRQLQRKLKALIDHSPTEYLRNYRLTMAKKKLIDGAQVGVVADAVGFSSQAYFASCFKTEFGATPSEFQQGLK